MAIETESAPVTELQQEAAEEKKPVYIATHHFAKGDFEVRNPVIRKPEFIQLESS